MTAILLLEEYGDDLDNTTATVSNAVQKTDAFQTFPLFAGLEQSQVGLKCGLFLGLVFPLVMVLGLRVLRTPSASGETPEK